MSKYKKTTQNYINVNSISPSSITKITTNVGEPDPDPLVRGTDPAPDPSLFS
jgi:hypothetical protein